MFYGMVGYDGTLATETANSNNWTCERADGTEQGYYKITLGQYLEYAPSVTISLTQNFGNTAPSGPAPYRTVAETFCRNGDGAWELYVTTRVGGNLADMGFSFTARSGSRRVFGVSSTADTITLDPEIVSFGGTKILMLKTSSVGLEIGSAPFYLDKGTALTGVGTTMKLVLGSTTVSDGDGNTWNLTGWTYGGGYGSGDGQTGTQWDAQPRSGSANYLCVDPSGTNGPATTPSTFAIKGVLESAKEGVPTYISSDPVVRLSSVSPGGLTL